MAKYVTSKVTEERVDPFTGEILATKIHKTIAVNNQEDFVMTFVGSLPLTNKLSEASLKVLNYVILNAGFAGDPPIGNIFNLNGFYDRIIESTGLKKSAITKAFKILSEFNLLIKDKKVRGIYYVNPLYFWKGKLSDRINSIDVSYKYVLKEEV